MTRGQGLQQIRGLTNNENARPNRGGHRAHVQPSNPTKRVGSGETSVLILPQSEAEQSPPNQEEVQGRKSLSRTFGNNEKDIITEANTQDQFCIRLIILEMQDQE